jgi:hypothetical protein
MSLQSESKTLRFYLIKKFWLKHHMLLMLITTGFAGILTNKWLVTLGVERIVIRYPLAVALCFLVFLFLMRVWLAYLSVVYDPRESVSFESDGQRFSAKDNSRSSEYDLSWLDPSGCCPDDLCGCLLFILLASVVVVAGSALALIYEAPIILAEALLQFLLAAGVIRTAKSIDRPDWVGSVAKRTWKPFALVLLMALLLGSCAEIVCDNPSGIKAMIKSCGNSR